MSDRTNSDPPQREELRRILVVEDDAEFRELLEEVLHEEGYDVVPAEDGAEALDEMDRMHGFCLILLDLMMPGMNGWDFLQKVGLEDRGPVPPIVVMTAADKYPDDLPVLRKPVALEDLREALELHCRAKPRRAN